MTKKTKNQHKSHVSHKKDKMPKIAQEQCGCNVDFRHFLANGIDTHSEAFDRATDWMDEPIKPEE
jgi:hypothetical protein